jgi:TRAP-type C4-dicarboxylate transport system permease small subunit
MAVGPDRGKHLRNIAIIVLLAVVVWLVPGGDAASLTVSNVLGVVFIGGLLFFGYRLYMENRDTILGLEERQRGILYASLALGTITLVATRRLWDEGGLGAVIWMVFIGLAVWGLFSVWQAYRQY